MELNRSALKIRNMNIVPRKGFVKNPSFLSFDNVHQARKWADEHCPSLRILPESKKEVVLRYTKTSYSNINKVLRGDTLLIYQDNLKLIEDLSDSLRMYWIPENIRVFRGTSKEELGKLSHMGVESLINRSFIERSFLSTSLLQEEAKKFLKDALMIIDVPKGIYGGAYLGDYSLNPEELEILFDKDKKLTINHAYYKEIEGKSGKVLVLRCLMNN